jgi:hypothetical protein
MSEEQSLACVEPSARSDAGKTVSWSTDPVFAPKLRDVR